MDRRRFIIGLGIAFASVAVAPYASHRFGDVVAFAETLGLSLAGVVIASKAFH